MQAELFPPPPADLGTEALQLLGRIGRLSRRFHALIGPALERELGLQTKELMVFGAIVKGHSQPSQISAVLGTPPPTTSRLLDALTEAGYLRRDAVPGDLRRFHMELTDLGAQTRQRALAVVSETMGRELVRAQIPEAQLQSALDHLSLLELSLGIQEDQ